MSLQSWLAEFMPHAANSEEAQRAPAAHANQKWEGLRPENLARHGVEKQDIWITDGVDRLQINLVTCALCIAVNYGYTEECTGCLLDEVRGAPCIDELTGESASPYAHWRLRGDPAPMIRDLERAAALEAERNHDGE